MRPQSLAMPPLSPALAELLPDFSIQPSQSISIMRIARIDLPVPAPPHLNEVGD